MRIASLLPAATEWICAFGGADDLVARSHECDAPPAVRSLPAVTRAAYAGSGDSAAIDVRVQQHLRDGLSLYDVDLDRLRALRPDLLVTQAQCEVCAVSRAQLDAALNDWAGDDAEPPALFSMEPMTFKQVLDTALRLGRTLGRAEAAMAFIAEQEQRLRAWQAERGAGRRAEGERPTVACIEWMEPLMTAGHWMPDLAEHAGGRAVLAEAGAPSRTIAWDALRAADPDVIAVLPCGFALDETIRDLHYLTARDGWADLRAVQQGHVVLLDGNAYFNRPGPRLYRSVRLLRAALAPAEADGTLQPWELRRLRDVEVSAG